ncbi:MAG: single-stranded DNA-binding protein [Pseudomonas sp.]
MKLIYEIHSTFVHERSGKSAKGRDYVIREQEAWIQIGDAPYPQKTKVMLEDGQAPYPVGKYQIHERSFSVGQYERTEFRAFLVPLAPPVQKAG